MIWWYVLAFFAGCIMGMITMALMTASKNNDIDYVTLYEDKDGKVVKIDCSERILVTRMMGEHLGTDEK